ncbi:MAG: stress response translation initiation inhibitor YciH [Dehalococcoidia bacterium]|nr:stress response translation initiation inhibitor YciH [Dehalococcoidia bacterium]
MPEPNSRLVYSTDGGRVKPGGLQPHNRRVEPPAKPQQGGGQRPPADGIVRIARDRKGRGGKTATTITGLPGTEADLDALLKRLKAACGTGGSREGRDLVLQGDLRERLRAELEALGHRVKLAGG